MTQNQLHTKNVLLGISIKSGETAGSTTVLVSTMIHLEATKWSYYIYCFITALAKHRQFVP